MSFKKDAIWLYVIVVGRDGRPESKHLARFNSKLVLGVGFSVCGDIPTRHAAVSRLRVLGGRLVS